MQRNNYSEHVLRGKQVHHTVSPNVNVNETNLKTLIFIGDMHFFFTRICQNTILESLWWDRKQRKTVQLPHAKQ